MGVIAQPRDKDYKFDFALFSETNASTIKHLRLENCLVCHPTDCDFTPFKHLRSLSLKRVKVDEILIESLLSNCRLLEELCLHYCLFKSSVPKIVSSSLYHLKVLGCSKPYYINAARYARFIDLMLVDCLKLTSLDCCRSDMSALNIYNTHVLRRIDFSVSFKEFKEYLDAFALCATFPELEIMRVEIFYTTVTTSLKIAQPLKHLKQLEFVLGLSGLSGLSSDEDCDLMVVLNILQASPLLQKLSIMLEPPNTL
ncbi:unnamed protein product [Trifolium pratense]|uniref:Uncharacterized protein n=1 Tax=Trifolium pratense TaxID=57577 RepID=A0ACB0IJF3_TRIPR|nr:unnamed protein product [Trifolium pratense]